MVSVTTKNGGQERLRPGKTYGSVRDDLGQVQLKIYTRPRKYQGVIKVQVRQY